MDDDINSWLERPLDVMEIEEMVFDCERDKSLGAGYFTLAVFQDILFDEDFS